MQSFEDKLLAANEILKRLNDENTPLDEAVALYEKGQALLNEANEILQNAKLKITQVEQEEFLA